MDNTIAVHDDLETLSRAAADRIVELAGRAVEQRGRFTVAFAGGSTPRRLYELLATDRYSEVLPWDKVEVWFGDERMVPWDHDDSNYRMAHKALLEHVPIPEANVHPVDTTLSAEKAAYAYGVELKKHLPPADDGMPVFDLVLLGMGDDGHTASLFPGTAILQERDKPVAAVFVDKFHVWRVSLTLPVIDRARAVMFLVAGEAKATVLGEVFAPAAAAVYPVQLIHPRGEVAWYLDTPAARRLPRDVAT